VTFGAACAPTEGTATAVDSQPEAAAKPAAVEPWAISDGAKAAAATGEWPRFRGPNRDGISGEAGFSKTWPEEGPKEIWRVPLGGGFSGISVAGGSLFTQYSREGAEWLGAFDPATGKETWRLRMDSLYTNRFGNGPRSTPTVDGEVVYSLSAKGKLYAVDAASGKARWTKDLIEEFGARIPQWGISVTPLIEGELLLVDAGGTRGRSIVALNKSTGETAWTTGEDNPGYSTPIVFTVDGVRQAVFFTASKILAVAPADGKILWEKPWKTSYDINAATPIFVAPNRLFVSSGYDTGSELLEIRRKGEGFEVAEVWQIRTMKNQFSSSVRVGNAIFGFDNKILKAIDLATGKDLWRQRGFSHGSLFYADDHLVLLGEEGRLGVAKASPESYQEISSIQVFNGKSWTVPTLAGDRLYLRDENEMISLDLSSKP